MSISEAKIKQFLATDSLDEFVGALSFEDGLAILEILVKQVESGNLPLAQAVTSYERGAILVSHLRRVLSQAESKLQLLSDSGTVTDVERP